MKQLTQPEKITIFNKTIIRILTAVFTFAVISASQSIFGQNCATAPGGLQAWYRAENNANDERGVNNATLQNGAMFAGGQVGLAFSLDGTNDFVSSPDSPSLDSLTTQATFEAWINPQMTGGDQFIFSHRSPFIHESFSVKFDINGAMQMIGGTTNSTPIGFTTPDGAKSYLLASVRH